MPAMYGFMKCEVPECNNTDVRLVQYFHPDRYGNPILRMHYYCSFHAHLIESGH